MRGPPAAVVLVDVVGPRVGLERPYAGARGVRSATSRSGGNKTWTIVDLSPSTTTAYSCPPDPLHSPGTGAVPQPPGHPAVITAPARPVRERLRVGSAPALG
ncbi:hypothetical protein [Actinomadura citrea]|uniref:hypothetical protein n=1 Tax=Actinomadura citrea TaxID=46158 RepID=UPI003CE4E4D3